MTQKHKSFGTGRIFKHLKNQSVAVVHAHDRNLSIHKFIREKCDSESHNDT